jgi:hypothetical protein
MKQLSIFFFKRLLLLGGSPLLGGQLFGMRERVSDWAVCANKSCGEWSTRKIMRWTKYLTTTGDPWSAGGWCVGPNWYAPDRRISYAFLAALALNPSSSLWQELLPVSVLRFIVCVVCYFQGRVGWHIWVRQGELEYVCHSGWSLWYSLRWLQLAHCWLVGFICFEERCRVCLDSKPEEILWKEKRDVSRNLYSKTRGKSHEEGMQTPAYTKDFGCSSNVSRVACTNGCWDASLRIWSLMA